MNTLIIMRGGAFGGNVTRLYFNISIDYAMKIFTEEHRYTYYSHEIIEFNKELDLNCNDIFNPISNHEL